MLSICRNGSERERRNTRTQIRLGPGVVHCYFAVRSIVHRCIKRSLFVDIVYRVMARRELTVRALSIVPTPRSRQLGDSELPRSLGKHRRLFPEDKLGITELPHLWKTQTCDLGLRGNSLSHEALKSQVQK